LKTTIRDCGLNMANSHRLHGVSSIFKLSG
jgi:hypothetical protein